LVDLCAAGDSTWRFKPLAGLAAVAATCGRSETAARLLGAVDELLDRTGARLLPFDRPAYDEAMAGARAVLDEPRFAAAHRAGHELAPVDVLAEAEAVVAAAAGAVPAADATPAAGSASAPADPFGLTRREREVLVLVCRRMGNPEIADALFLSVRTVENHVANLFGKLGVAKRREAIAAAARLGLAEPA
jgi:DNA-binding CsgD family transcriptional regulator